MYKAYQSSRSNIPKTQEDIRRTLIKYGADGVQFEELFQDRKVTIRFMYKINDNPYIVKIIGAIPETKRETPSGRYLRSDDLFEKKKREASIQIWRALFTAIKSRMESISFGIETFEEAFLAHIEIPGSDKTIGNILTPRLQSGKLLLTDRAGAK